MHEDVVYGVTVALGWRRRLHGLSSADVANDMSRGYALQVIILPLLCLYIDSGLRSEPGAMLPSVVST